MARILIVDDDESVRRVLRLLLERAGHAVVEAESGDDALAMLPSEACPDAVVSDVLMPGISGLAFYQELVVRVPSLRHNVVFLTGANSDPAVHRPVELLGVPLLGKLDDLQLVVDAIRIALMRSAST